MRNGESAFMEYTRTDLALEKRTLSTEKGNFTVLREEESNGIEITELCHELKGKECKFVTVSSDKFWSFEGTEKDMLVNITALEIRKMARKMCNKALDNNLCVLVAGLGNSNITADAIGPLTVQKLTVTRHLKNLEPEIFKALELCEISAVTPGVLGETGIETVELIRGAAENANPDIIIAVDALSAGALGRLASVIQISDGGISPGSGIGNTRKAINRDTLGIPVLSIGVPTVVDSSTLVYSALEKADMRTDAPELLSILENGRGYFVTPKECDLITQKTSDILSEVITKAFTVFDNHNFFPQSI